VTGVVVYDSGMLIALVGRKSLAQHQHRQIIRHTRPIVPGPVLGQVWRDGPSTRYILGRYLRECSVHTDYTEHDYKRIGVILGDALLPAKKRPDVVDALVVLTAVKHGRTSILTSDPDDIGAYLDTLPKADVRVIGV
jgi:predicted nucleic acid-binding protein